MSNYRKVHSAFTEARALQYFANFLANFTSFIPDEDVFDIVERSLDKEDIVARLRAKLPEADFSSVMGKVPHEPQEAPDLPVDADFFMITEHIQGFFTNLWNNKAYRRDVREVLVKAARAKAQLLIRRDKGASSMRRRLRELQETLRLSDLEADVLFLILILSRRQVDLSFCYGGFRRDLDIDSRVDVIAACLDAAPEDIQAALSTTGKLRRFDCLDEDLDLSPTVRCFLAGTESTPLASVYYNKDVTPPLPWEFFGDDLVEKGEFVKQLIEASGKAPENTRGMNILFYGVPGTGKTSFARTLASKMGRDCYFISQGGTSNGRERVVGSPSFRFGALQICDGQVDRSLSLVVVDEADELLGTSSRGDFLGLSFSENQAASRGKGILNSILDSIRCPVVWITNTPASALDISSRRRFDYSIRFDELSQVQREAIWKNNIAKYHLESLFEKKEVAALAARYQTNAGGIALALANVADIAPAKEEAGEVVAKLMEPHCELMQIPSRADAFTPARDYSLDGLAIRTPIPLDRLTQCIRNFRSGSGIDSPDRPRMNLLLSGPPGTGKTEFVKYLGQELGAKVVVRMGSDLLDCFVGNTEKRIREAFRRAAAEQSILFLDEADGLLHPRKGAQQRWEVTQVNELLHQMEDFGGVLICATNFADNLDAATVRRFTFKVEFDYLDNDGKAVFFERMFGTKLTAEERRELDAIRDLAPGDFRTVRQSYYYLGDETTNADRLEALRHESAAKRKNLSTERKVGFSAA